MYFVVNNLYFTMLAPLFSPFITYSNLIDHAADADAAQRYRFLHIIRSNNHFNMLLALHHALLRHIFLYTRVFV